MKGWILTETVLQAVVKVVDSQIPGERSVYVNLVILGPVNK